jgi:hypothetical protein
MKDFILYLKPRERIANPVKEKYSLDELKKTPGTSLISELEFVKDGEIRQEETLGDYTVFKFSCKYTARHGPSLVTVERDIELWQSKSGALVASFGFPRKVAKVATKLLSLATFGDYSLINSFNLTNPDFFELKKRVQELGGTVTQLEVRGVSWGGGQLRHFEIKGQGLEKIPGFDEIFGKAKKISSIGFSLPNLNSSTRYISFRVLDWGGGQIYSPSDPLPHELASLFSLIENVLFGDQERIRQSQN